MPCELVALQPVQLVSITPVPGVTEKAAFGEFAVPRPLPQPAANSSAGARSSENFLKNSRMVNIPIYIVSTTSGEKLDLTQLLYIGKEKRVARLPILKARKQVAGATSCKLVYAIVPRICGTLVELAERETWMKELGRRDSRHSCALAWMARWLKGQCSWHPTLSL